MLQAIDRANQRAEKIAAGLKVKIVGVHGFRMHKIGKGQDHYGAQYESLEAPRMKMMALDLGTPLA